MKKRNWMNKLSNRAMGMMAAMALMVTATTVNQCCMWFLGQDEMPKGSEKLRRFKKEVRVAKPTVGRAGNYKRRGAGKLSISHTIWIDNFIE